MKVFKCPEDFSKEEPHENHKNEVEGRLKKEFDQVTILSTVYEQLLCM